MKYFKSSLIIKYGSTASGFVSQAFTNIALGLESIEGVLLKGLDLNAFHRPEFIRRFVMLSLVSNSTQSSSSAISISIDKNFLLSPLLISLTTPPAGEV